MNSKLNTASVSLKSSPKSTSNSSSCNLTTASPKSIQKYSPESSAFSSSVKNPVPTSVPPIVFRTLIHLDLESDLFMKVALGALYSEHQESLLPCGKCGRKFYPDRISRHELNCNAEPVIIHRKKQQSETQVLTFAKKHASKSKPP